MLLHVPESQDPLFSAFDDVLPLFIQDLATYCKQMSLKLGAVIEFFTLWLHQIVKSLIRRGLELFSEPYLFGLWPFLLYDLSQAFPP